MLLLRIKMGSLGLIIEGSFLRQGHDLDLVFIRRSRLEFCLLAFLLASCMFSTQPVGLGARRIGTCVFSAVIAAGPRARSCSRVDPFVQVSVRKVCSFQNSTHVPAAHR